MVERSPEITTSGIDARLERLSWQSVLSAAQPSRWALTKLQASWALQDIEVRVHRNLPFELLEPLMAPFMAYSGYRCRYDIGAYDEALALPASNGDVDVDVEIIAYEFDRFDPKTDATELARLVAERVTTVRARTKAPILVVDWLANHARAAAFNAELAVQTKTLAGVYVGVTKQLAQELGDRIYDDRAADVRGTRYGDAALIGLARHLGLQWIPALVAPRLKMVAIDADETLYSGVVAEDGIQGVTLHERHIELQRSLLELRASGVLLALISRNEPADVDALFDQHPDFLLRRHHFFSMQVGWNDKGDSLAAASQAANIDTSAIVFIDDNIGELASVTHHRPGVGLLHADANGSATAMLPRYPGLYTFGISEADQLRSADLEASAARRALAGADAADPSEYLRSLQVELRYSPIATDVPRGYELSNKTNQFNLNLSRLSEAEVAAIVDDQHRAGVLVGLKDRLSDSGLVAFVATECQQETLVVTELCISCRALGRHLEDTLILQALQRCAGSNRVETIRFEFRKGPRNGPALNWLRELTGQATDDEAGVVDFAWTQANTATILDNTALTIKDVGNHA